MNGRTAKKCEIGCPKAAYLQSWNRSAGFVDRQERPHCSAVDLTDAEHMLLSGPSVPVWQDALASIVHTLWESNSKWTLAAPLPAWLLQSQDTHRCLDIRGLLELPGFIC